MDSLIPQLSLGGILVVVILREVFGFLRDNRTRRNGLNNGYFTEKDRANLTKIHDMHASPQAYDDDGIPRWYVPRSWGSHIQHTEEKMSQLVQLQQEILATLRQNGKK